MSYFASSASPDVAHWHDQKPTHLMWDMIEEGFDTLLEGTRELFVTAEHSLGQLADELGIHSFSHQISCDLTGCRLVLQPHGHLEIHREWAKHTTSFPITFRDQEIVEA